jgi:type II secretory pathway component PulF
MPIFQYKAKDRQGQLINGTLEADSRLAVSSRLQTMGYFPLDVRGATAADGSKGGRGPGRRSPRIRGGDLSNFYRQMSDLIGAGVPLVKALGIVKIQTPNPALQAVLGQVSADVQEGATFAAALEKHPKAFPKLSVALVRSGETGGLLDQVLARVADFAESHEELKGKIKSALAYPAIMVVVGTAAIIVILGWVMPRVLTIFRELNQTLPLPTQILIVVSNFLGSRYGLFLAGGLAAGVFALRRFIATERGAQKYHAFLLRIPQFGDLLLKREVAAFARTLGALLQNGVPILNALAISSEVVTLVPIRDEIRRIPEGITQGAGIAPTLRASKIFPPVAVNMVAIGEETGHLPEVLMRVANSYEMQVDRAVKTLTSFIEPAIILVLGLIVGAIVISMLLPIFSIDPSQGM